MRHRGIPIFVSPASSLPAHIGASGTHDPERWPDSTGGMILTQLSWGGAARAGRAFMAEISMNK